ncbi:hypothetical protein Gotur_013170 [Gossypium turneri]
MKEETPLKHIADEAKISKNKEINPRLCKSPAPDQTTAKFLQAKSTASAMSAQAKTKKEYKKLMVEMLSSMDSESEDEKSSASSIKTVHLADNTTSVTITRTKKMMKKKEMNEEEQEIFSSVNSKYSLVRTVRFSGT